MPDTYDLARFVAAQAQVYDQALTELIAGRKQGHWMWFIFPQLAGLGRSATARLYGINSRDEASSYLAHPVLGLRLVECTATILRHAGTAAEEILGPIDAVKFRSSMTLFEAAGGEPLFAQALHVFCGGTRDPATLALLG